MKKQLALILTTLLFTTTSFSQNNIESSQKKPSKMTRSKSKAVGKTDATISKVKLKEGQFSIDKDNKITVFSTKSFGEVTLSEHCFKNSKSIKPNCEAFNALNKKVDHDKVELKSPFHNNRGAIHCELIGGQSVIVKTSSQNESDFCLFKDGSLVSSWSAYYFHQNQNKK